MDLSTIIIAASLVTSGYCCVRAWSLHRQALAKLRVADAMLRKLREIEAEAARGFLAFVDEYNEQLSQTTSNRFHRTLIPVVTYLPEGQRVPLTSPKSLLHLAHSRGVSLSTACGGVGNCGICAITVHQGADNLPPMNQTERGYIGETLHEGQRLACQCIPTGHVQVERVLK